MSTRRAGGIARKSLRVFTALVCVLVTWNSLMAQDLRVYTKVTDVSNGEQPQPLSHSLTLFHGGRVYDYMEEVGEVVIFEPIHNRFIILGKNFRATEVAFAEVNHFLETAQTEAVQYIEELSAKPDASAKEMAALVQFQMSPEFQLSFDEEKHRLTLTGSKLSYSVSGQAIRDSSLLNRYLEYADWAKRLNYVLHRNASLPQARLQLNEQLRAKQILPSVVELKLHVDPTVEYRAEHRFSEEFRSIDRQHIHHWERMLDSDRIEWMTFREYQQNLLVHSKQ